MSEQHLKGNMLLLYVSFSISCHDNQPDEAPQTLLLHQDLVNRNLLSRLGVSFYVPLSDSSKAGQIKMILFIII